ncbi:MAG TPA: M15 family metallopeptidase [Acidimicrobiia bacterium]|jgi:D-alanyl-D-alanine dipeptidase
MSKLVGVLVLCLAVALPVHAAVGDPSYGPVSDEALVDDLIRDGYRNGRMASTRLLEVEGCLLERDAAYTLSLLLEEAREDGITLVAHECYRSLDAQQAAYERRCPVVEEEIKKIDPVTGEETVVKVKKGRSCSGPPIARPGRSNHGWGRAIDFGNGRRVLSCGDAAFAWLQENASRFGWVHPSWARCGRSTQEPWHWEWGGLTEDLPLLTPTVSEQGRPNALIR